MSTLLKVHGSQNSFFILDQTLLEQPLTDAELVKLTTTLTSPKTGILGGADGILVVNHSTKPDTLGKMRVINADGSEASMCGNGLRTVARYLAQKHGQDQFKVETLQADLLVAKKADFASGVPTFGVEISPVHFDKKYLPFDNLGADKIVGKTLAVFDPDEKINFSILAVPNPHLIGFVPDIKQAKSQLATLGQQLNSPNPYFSDGININFAQVLGKNKLFVQTYERGVGFTNACGTGMSATSLAFYLTQPENCDFEQDITVYNPGGMVKTHLKRQAEQFSIELIGNATFTHEIKVTEDDLHANNVDENNCQITETGEQDTYLKFIEQLN